MADVVMTEFHADERGREGGYGQSAGRSRLKLEPNQDKKGEIIVRVVLLP